MTPTEQDNELEAQLDKIFPCDCSFMKGFAFRPGDPCDGSCVNAPYRKAVMQLITADRKRVALEAEINTWKQVRKSYPKKQTLQGCAVSKLTLADVDRKITELKAQQEEVK